MARFTGENEYHIQTDSDSGTLIIIFMNKFFFLQRKKLRLAEMAHQLKKCVRHGNGIGESNMEKTLSDFSKIRPRTVSNSEYLTLLFLFCDRLLTSFDLLTYFRN